MRLGEKDFERVQALAGQLGYVLRVLIMEGEKFADDTLGSSTSHQSMCRHKMFAIIREAAFAVEDGLSLVHGGCRTIRHPR